MPQPAQRVVGLVPVGGRGALPSALLQGEPLTARASRALTEAGVEVLDPATVWSVLRGLGATLVVHDPLCAGTPVQFLREAVTAVVATGSGPSPVVVGVRPVTDTVRTVTEAGALGATVDRATLLAVASPVVVPAPVLASLPEPPPLDDLADLVAALRPRQDVLFLEAPAPARRVGDDSDLRLLEALLR
jgi:2-C-methyl-D-erythritol 4-phosphate cytidylyltransferase